MTVELPAQRGPHRMTALFTAILALIAITWFLQATYIVTMPTAFAFFLAMLVLPVQRWANNRLPGRLRGFSLLPALLVMVLLVIIGGGLIYLSAILIADKWAQYTSQAQAYYASVTSWAQARGLLAEEGITSLTGAYEKIVGVFAVLAKSLWSFLAMLILIYILAVLMLMEVRDWKRKVRRAFSRAQQEGVIDTVETIALRVRQFMLVRTALSLAEAATQGVFLWIAGVDFAFVWALLFFILNFMPYLGSIIAVVPPVVMALFQYGPWWAAMVLMGLFTIDQIMGNFLATRVQGKALQISPAVLTVAVLYWGFVWGIAGALLAVPLTATIIIACDNIPGLQPLALLLSDTAGTTGARPALRPEQPTK